MILQVINSLRIGGAERFVIETAVQMHKTGNPVEVLVFDRAITPFTKILSESGVKIRYTQSSSYFSPLNIITFIGIILSRRYNVIHTHLTYAQFWGAIISLLNIHRKKLVTTEHSNENNRRGNRGLRIIDLFIYSRYSTIICISETVRESLLGWLKCKNTSKYIIIPNCVNCEKFQDASPLDRNVFGLSASQIVIMMVGRMSKAKDQLTIIRATESLPDDYVCILVGDGETLPTIKAAVRNPNKTIFTGARIDIAQLLAMCDIYVQSSHWEGMPTTVLEAMAAGKVVLGSNVKGNKDIIPAEQQFEEGNSKELASKILNIDQFRDQAIARQNIELNRFSLNVICNQLCQCYTKDVK